MARRPVPNPDCLVRQSGGHHEGGVRTRAPARDGGADRNPHDGDLTDVARGPVHEAPPHGIRLHEGRRHRGVAERRVGLHRATGDDRPGLHAERVLGVPTGEPGVVPRRVVSAGPEIIEPDLVVDDRVAVAGGGPAINRRIGREAHQIVRHPVAVVVLAVVVDIGRAGVDRRVAVVAVRAAGRHHVVPVAVEVVGIRTDPAFIDPAHAVVVDAVADLRGSRVDAGVAVIAVLAVLDVAHGDRAVQGRGGGVAEAVRVEVSVVRVEHPIVDHGVAVVVRAVAHLGVAGECGGVRIVAVVVHGGEAFRLGTCPLAGGTRAVAVAVRIGEERGGSGRGRLDALVGSEHDLVDPVHAVVVDPVADLGIPGEGGDFAVVAIVGVVEGDTLDHLARADEAVPGTRGGVPVGAGVGRDRAERRGGIVAGRVRVEHLVDPARTVVVDAVADLRRRGVDRGVRVVAVAARAHLVGREAAHGGCGGVVAFAVVVAVGERGGLGIGHRRIVVIAVRIVHRDHHRAFDRVGGAGVLAVGIDVGGVGGCLGEAIAIAVRADRDEDGVVGAVTVAVVFHGAGVCRGAVGALEGLRQGLVLGADGAVELLAAAGGEEEEQGGRSPKLEQHVETPFPFGDTDNHRFLWASRRLRDPSKRTVRSSGPNATKMAYIRAGSDPEKGGRNVS